MNIYYLSNSTIPSRTANSIHVMKMCQAFAQHGHKVTLVARKCRNQAENVNNVYQYYGVDPIFEIIYIPGLPVKGGWIFYSLFSAMLSAKAKPDLIFGRDVSACFFSLFYRAKIYFETHQPLEDSGKLSAMMFRHLIKSEKLKKIIVITNSLKDHLQKNYPLTKNRLHVAADGADPIDENLNPIIFAGDAKRLQVGYVGHLYEGRGVELVVKLAQLSPQDDFHLVGGREQDISYWKKKTTGISNITFHGFVSPIFADAYRLGCDVLVAPYQQSVSLSGGGDTSKWMSPLKIFEYMAAGKPIICSDLPVLREVLVNKLNALLCPSNDVESWLNALNDLRSDLSLRKSLGETAKKNFLESYTWHARAATILSPEESSEFS